MSGRVGQAKASKTNDLMTTTCKIYEAITIYEVKEAMTSEIRLIATSPVRGLRLARYDRLRPVRNTRIQLEQR